MSSRETKVPAIPAPTNSNDLEFKKAVKALIDVREGYVGDPLDVNVTLRDLNDARFLSSTAVVNIIGGGVGLPPGYVPPVLTPPPAPTGLAQSAAITSIFLSWDTLPVGYASNHGYTEVWRSPANTLGSAVMIGTSLSMFYVDALGSTGAAFYYWVRYRSAADVAGPYNGVSGLFAQTGLIGNVDLGPLIIEAGNLAAGAVDATKFVSTIQPVTIVLGALPTVLSTRTIFLASDSKLYRWSGTAYVATVSTADLAGTIADAQIAALSAAKITGTLNDSQIADLAAAKLTGVIAGTQIANDAITTPKIFAGAITTAKIAANAVTANEIAANAVTAAKINAGAVTAAKIAANTITAGQIAANTITAGQIAAASITAAEIAADSITSGQIAAGAITAGKIAANAIAVGSAAIQNGAIVNAMIANATIDSAKIANLNAALLTVGDGSIGGNLKSAVYTAGSGSTPGAGWLLTPDGTLHATGAVIYGTIYASTGTLGTLTIGSGGYVRSANYVAETSGFTLESDGKAEFASVMVRNASGNVILNALGSGAATPPWIVGATSVGGGVDTTTGLTVDSALQLRSLASGPGIAIGYTTTGAIQVSATSPLNNEVQLAADETTTTVGITPANMTLPLLANTTYLIRGRLMVKSADSTTGHVMGCNVPSGAATVLRVTSQETESTAQQRVLNLPSGASGTVVFTSHFAATQAAPTVFDAGSFSIMEFEASVMNGSTEGIFQLVFGSSVPGSSVTMRAGSSMTGQSLKAGVAAPVVLAGAPAYTTPVNAVLYRGNSQSARATAAVSVLKDGTWATLRTGGASTTGNWAATPAANVGLQWQVKFVPTAGALSSNGAAEWTSVGSTLTASLAAFSPTGSGLLSINSCTVQIRFKNILTGVETTAGTVVLNSEAKSDSNEYNP